MGEWLPGLRGLRTRAEAKVPGSPLLNTKRKRVPDSEETWETPPYNYVIKINISSAGTHWYCAT